MDDEGKEDRLGIQSVEIAADILRALAEGGGAMAVRDLAAATGMHRAKIHRYLTSLARSGLVAQDSRFGSYTIGKLAVQIGLVGLRRITPLRMASEALAGLRDQVNETTVLAIWGEMGATVVALEESIRAVTMNVRVGWILPMRTTATGQVFAAFMPEPVVAAALAAEGLARSARESEDFRALMETVRQRRMAAVRGSLIGGVNAIAAPVFDHRGTLLASMGIVGRQETLDVSAEGPAATALRRAVGELSQRLGFTEAAATQE